jgi:hypothetical protein
VVARMVAEAGLGRGGSHLEQTRPHPASSTTAPFPLPPRHGKLREHQGRNCRSDVEEEQDAWLAMRTDEEAEGQTSRGTDRSSLPRELSTLSPEFRSPEFR